MNRVVVTGLGTINPCGNNAEDTWDAGPTLPHEVSECIATVHDGKVYLLSWEEAALEILVYRDGAWEQGTAENRDCDVAACDSILLG